MWIFGVDFGVDLLWSFGVDFGVDFGGDLWCGFVVWILEWIFGVVDFGVKLCMDFGVDFVCS